MQIEQLDLETRNKIYCYTKKILRKYQKGITSGKLTADKFADNILSHDFIGSIVDEKIVNESEFKASYIDYIETLIKIQNENLFNLRKKSTKTAKCFNISQVTQLKNLLNSTGYNLLIPYKYLTSKDIEGIVTLINTGSIELGNERIYNYISKA
ncbi:MULTISPECIES: hypothetical protein [unclassified Clostridioides]|uniref:hypothetical protein n=1 Tax=unclassified Clostridioides TaxID=2635829 RepID=UPI001D105771|nr:hypothetical protein [Clostridioides sp. ES-S-0171-01]MCC0689142.1 hypothetical protein [Clostridioides sp. ES-S-0056-01]MCC0716038.1 hypothetical protein [Clostridioides sp. ES-S-0077-01]UDN53813.1 hypothetical protein JJC02_13000 [Clostridioides sp. ES-S-0054-01]